MEMSVRLAEPDTSKLPEEFLSAGNELWLRGP
jgi:hypothetical protein